MKRINVATLIVACIVLLASCASTEGGEVDINALTEGVQKIVEVPELSQNEIFVKANNWAVSAFSNADSVIEFSDKESGTITGKYAMRYHGKSATFWAGGDVAPWTLMEINVKEGRARISLKLSSLDFYNGNGAKFSSSNLSWHFVQADADVLTERWTSLIADFEKALKKEDVDW